MSYVNFKLLKERGITPVDLMFLQAVKQQKIEDAMEPVAMLLDDMKYEHLTEAGIVHEIKGTAKMNEIERIRLTPKGNKFLEECYTGDITQGDIEMFNHLCEMYLDSKDEERSIGNKKKTLRYCSVFRNHLSLTLHEMYWLCWLFLQEYEYTKKLEYVFFNSNKNRYGKFENAIEDSPLYQFYDEQKIRIEKLWKQRIKN